MISLRHEVEREEHEEAHRGEQQGRHEGALLPLSPLERLVKDGARVARRHPHEHVQQKHGHRQAAAVGRVYKADNTQEGARRDRRHLSKKGENNP